MTKDLQQTLKDINRARRTGDTAVKDTTVESTYQPSIKLFVYGTLKPGQTNEWVLQKIGGRWKEATARGHIQQPEPGHFSYPRFTPDPTAPKVKGHLFISFRLPRFWDKLDHFEGAAYQRLLIPVQHSDGVRDVANVYAAAR